MPPRFAFRASKFRNLECTPAAREASYDQLHVTSAAVEGSAVAAALDRWAFAHQIDGGAAIQVKALGDTGKDAATLPPLLRGHQARVNALEFSPFRSDVLLSGSADATVKVWKLPSDATSAELPSAASATLSGADSSVVGVRHHPSAAQLAAAVSHRDVLVLDLEAEAVACHVTPLDGSDDDALSSVAWNYDGSALVTSSLLQQVRLLDPRADAVVETFKAHTGRRRPTSVAWCGRLDLLVTTGCDAVQERELKLWDLRHTAKPLARERLDASIGQLFPLYDADVDLLYVLGKGDRSVRAFEVDAAGLHKLSQTLLPHMTLGAALLPKQACDARVCEVARVLSLSANGGGSSGVCDVLSFTVPRRDARSEFQRDLYPDTLARSPALTAAQWTSGENAVPVLERVAPTESTVASAVPANGGHGSVFGFGAPAAPSGWGASAPAPPSQPQTQAAASAPSSSGASSNGWGNSAVSPWASTTSSAWGTSTASPDKPSSASSATSGWTSKTTAWNAAAPVAAPSAAATAAQPVQWFTPEPMPPSQAEEAEAAAKAAAESAEKVVSKNIARFTTSQGHKLKYIKGTQSTRNDTLNLGDKTAASSCIRANASYMAIPLQGAGGPVLVSPLSATGRVGADALVLDGHKATVTDVAFHSFDDNILATGSGDATVAIWKLNGEPSTPHTVLRGHTKGVRSLEFHTRAADVLCSTAQDLSIRLWDVEVGAERVCLSDKLEDFVWNTAFSPDGSLLATSSRERLVRVFDPRAAHDGHALVAMGCGFDSMRPQFVSWLSPSQLVTLGTTGAPRHETQLRIWDARNLVDPVSSTTIDAAAAESTLMYDASSRVLFLASSGGRQIWSYEISGGDGDTQAHAVYANLPFVADGLQPISAAALLPKRLCNVREAEIDRVLLLRGNVVEKVSFALPRNDKLRAYFQDDVFGDIPTLKPSLSSSDWFAGAQAVVEYESLCPEGMTPLSEKPEEEKSVPMSQQFRAKWEAAEREKKLKAENLERLQALAAQPSLHAHGQAHAAASRQNDESDDDWDD